jgi:DNA polymerase III epsilon subunit-like protein
MSSSASTSWLECQALVIWFDTETTGLSHTSDQIVEIAARVDPRWWDHWKDLVDQESDVPDLSFESLVKHTCVMGSGAFAVHKIPASELAKSPSFALASAAFCKWIDSWRVLMTNNTDATKIVLAAHCGTSLDFPLWDRQLRDSGITHPESVVYADTMPVFTKMSNCDGSEKGKFRLQNIHAEYCESTSNKSSNTQQMHRAMADVDMLIEAATAFEATQQGKGFMHKMITRYSMTAAELATIKKK